MQLFSEDAWTINRHSIISVRMIDNHENIYNIDEPVDKYADFKI